MSNAFMPNLAKIVSIKDETSDIRTLTMSMAPHNISNVSPGQFVEISIFGYGEFPVSVSNFLDEDGCFQVTIQGKGRVTTEIKNLTVGKTIGFRGPFGNGFPLEAMHGKDIYIVTGGIGLAAVWLLIQTLLKYKNDFGKITLLHGARTSAGMIYRDSFIHDRKAAAEKNMEVFLTIDNAEKDWKENVGVVTNLFDKAKVSAENAVAVICGPGVMMKFALQGLIDRGFDESRLILSMERRMQCGIGVCGHCMIGYKRVCLDGPVFYYSDIKNSLDKIF